MNHFRFFNSVALLRLSARLLLSHLKTQPFTLFIQFFSVIVASALLISSAQIYYSIDEFFDRTEQALKNGSNATISSDNGSVFDLPNGQNNWFTQFKVEQRDVEFVESIQTHSKLLLGSKQVSLTLLGLNLTEMGWAKSLGLKQNPKATSTKSKNPMHFESDSLSFIAQADSVALPSTLASSLGLKLGDTIKMTFPTGLKTLVVRAVIENLDESEGSSIVDVMGSKLAIMDIDSVRQCMGRETAVTRVDLFYKKPTNSVNTHLESDSTKVSSGATNERQMEEWLKSKEPMLSAINLHVSSDTTKYFRESLAGFRSVLLVIVLITIILGFFAILAAQSLRLFFRQKEFGLIRQMGASAREIGIINLSESLVIASVSGIIGLILGFVLTGAFAKAISSGTGRAILNLNPYSTSILQKLLIAGPVLFLLVIVLSAAASTLASFRLRLLSPLHYGEDDANKYNSVNQNPSFLKQTSLVALMLFLMSLYLSTFEGGKWISIGQLIAVHFSLAFLVIAIVRQVFQVFNSQNAFGLSFILVKRKPRHTSSLYLFAICVSSTLMLGEIVYSYRGETLRWMGNYSKFDLSATSQGGFVSEFAQPITENVLSDLSKEVMAYVALRHLNTTVEGQSVNLKAYDALNPDKIDQGQIFPFRWVEGDVESALAKFHADQTKSSNNPNTVYPVFVSETFVKVFKKKMGDRFNVRGRIFEISAVVTDLSSMPSVTLQRRHLTELFDDHLINRVSFKFLKDDIYKNFDRSYFENKYSNLGLIFMTEKELTKDATNTIDTYIRSIMGFFIFVTFFFILIVVQQFFQETMQRKHDFYLLFCVGQSKRELIRHIMMEIVFEKGLVIIVLGFLLFSERRVVFYSLLPKIVGSNVDYVFYAPFVFMVYVMPIVFVSMFVFPTVKQLRQTWQMNA